MRKAAAGGEIAAANPIKDGGAAFGHVASDLQWQHVPPDRPFKQQQVRDREMESDASGRPKYGRRRYPLTLFPADFDLLKL